MRISDLKDYHVVSTGTPVAQSTTSGVGSRVGSVISNRGAQVRESIMGTGADSGKSSVRRGFEAVAEASGTPFEAALEASPAVIREPIKAVGDQIGNAFTRLTDFIGSNPDLIEFVQKNPKLASALEEVAGTASAGGQIAGNILGTKAATSLTQKATSATASGALNLTTRATSGILERSKNIVTPSPTAKKAVGEVLQGKTKDVKPGMQAIGALDIEGIKTFAQFRTKIDDTIKTLAEKVDGELSKDTTVRQLDKLLTKAKTKSGTEVTRNYVETALKNLQELYEKTADDINLAETTELFNKARTTGISRQEINDISRIYGQEFGQKAFSKLGDPLTSVNAQMYENIRTGLKTVARNGIGGKAAKEADALISSLYNTRTLVQNSVEAVQKLQQRISERGLLEKIGHHATKFLDVASGGTIRGLIGGLLPRGAGYKVMNALDIEERLEKNLKIIKDAVNAKTDAEVIELLKKLQQSATTPKAEATTKLASSDNSTRRPVGPPSGQAGFIKLPGVRTEIESYKPASPRNRNITNEAEAALKKYPNGNAAALEVLRMFLAKKGGTALTRSEVATAIDILRGQAKKR